MPTVKNKNKIRDLSLGSDSDDIDQRNPKTNENGEKMRNLGGNETEQANKTCLVCDGKDNWVLACHGEECPIAIHQSCLSNEPDFDEFGCFHCPYCWYKRVLVKSAKLQKKHMETWDIDEDVVRVTCEGDESYEKFVSMEKDQRMKEVAADTDSQESSNNGNDYDDEKTRKQRTDKKVARTRKQRYVDEQKKASCNDKRVVMMFNEQENGSNKDELIKEPNSVSSSISSPISTDNVKDSCQELALIIHPIAIGKEQPIEATPIDARPCRFMPSINGVLSNDLRQCSSSSRKRKRLFWTQAEEEMLKVGVEKFPGKRNIPWRKILEYGKDVFNEERLPSDLKDKWRTMNKMLLETGKWVTLSAEHESFVQPCS
ncbi:unnamed protein product [Cochlearia groenlandica]